MSVPVSKKTEEMAVEIRGLLAKVGAPMKASAMRKRLRPIGNAKENADLISLALGHLKNIGVVESWSEGKKLFKHYWLKGVPVVAHATKHPKNQAEHDRNEAAIKEEIKNPLTFIEKVEQQKPGWAKFVNISTAGSGSGGSYISPPKRTEGSIIMPKWQVKLLLESLLEAKSEFNSELEKLILELTDKVS